MKKNVLLLSMLIASAISAQTLDSSYGFHGKSFNFLTLNYVSVSSSFFLPNNKLIVSGTQGDGFSEGSFIASFTATGKPDFKFGGTGIRLVNDLSSAFTAAQRPNKIVMASWYPTQVGSYQQLVVSRYVPAGKPDSSFGTNGRFYYSAGGYDQYEYPTCMSIDKLGNIYIGGVFNRESDNVLIIRLRPNGSFDSTFRIIGEKSRSCQSLLLLNNGSLLAGFYNKPSTGIHTASIMKFNLKGKPDMSFANKGVLNLSIIDGSASNTVYLQEAGNGSFIVLYYHGNNLVFQKFNANGTPDNSFGNNSIADTQGATSSTFAVDENGNILQPLSYFRIKRYTRNGMTDLSFGDNGFLTTDFNEFGLDNAYGTFSNIIPQPGGFYVTGSYDADENLVAGIAVAKYKTSPPAVAANNNTVQKKVQGDIAKIILAPNPVRDILNITNLPAKSHIIIMNAQGAIVKSVAVTSNSMKLNVENLSSGIYYVSVKETNQKEKFVKL